MIEKRFAAVWAMMLVVGDRRIAGRTDGTFLLFREDREKGEAVLLREANAEDLFSVVKDLALAQFPEPVRKAQSVSLCPACEGAGGHIPGHNVEPDAPSGICSVCAGAGMVRPFDGPQTPQIPPGRK